MVIGIIGKIGSGKSTCVNCIKEIYGATVFNCDDIAKEMVKNKEVDYEVVSGIEFFTNENLQELCRIKLHPIVFSRIKNNINNFINKNNITDDKSKKSAYDVSKNILSKNNFMNYYEQIFIIETALPGQMLFDMCDKTILIESSFEDKAKWLFDSREYGVGKTKLIYDSQKYYEKFYEMADYKIVNDGNIDGFKKKIKEVIDEICVAGK